MVLEQIAATVDCICQLSAALQVNAFVVEKDAQAVTVAIERMAHSTGIMADMCGARCGAPSYVMVKGGPDAWLMPSPCNPIASYGEAANA